MVCPVCGCATHRKQPKSSATESDRGVAAPGLTFIIGVPIAWLLHAVKAGSAFKVMGLPLMTFGSACATSAAQMGISLLYGVVGYGAWSLILVSESPNIDMYGELLVLSALVNSLVSYASIFMWRHKTPRGSAFAASLLQFLAGFLVSALIGFITSIAALLVAD